MEKVYHTLQGFIYQSREKQYLLLINLGNKEEIILKRILGKGLRMNW